MNDLREDFGFTTMNEDDIKAASGPNELEQMEYDRLACCNDLRLMRQSIQKLLDNLKDTPEKEYIHWPNRKEKIEEFELKLDQIVHKYRHIQ